MKNSNPSNTNKNLYETLGVHKEISPAGLKSAYYALSKLHHPDKGGDSEKMKEIAFAYSILSDPEKRQRYDETGSVEKEKPIEVEAQNFILSIMQEALNANAKNCLKYVERELGNRKLAIINQQREMKDKIKELKVKRKFIKKIKGKIEENYFHYIIDEGLKNIQIMLEQSEETIKVIEFALAELENYESKETDNIDKGIVIRNPTFYGGTYGS